MRRSLKAGTTCGFLAAPNGSQDLTATLNVVRQLGRARDAHPCLPQPNNAPVQGDIRLTAVVPPCSLGELDALSLALAPGFDLHRLTDGAMVAIMSHSYSQDRHWLGSVLQGAPAYIGQLGPRDRTERLLDEIRQHSEQLPSLERLHYPIGLDIGGDTPESVATAILAEMTAALNQRDGGMLKHRQAAIHAPTPQDASELETVTRLSAS